MESITKLKVQLIGIFLIAGMMFGAVVVNGQTGPGWTVNPGDYEFNGEVNAVVVLDGADMTSGMVGAFVGDECRGVVDGTYYPNPSGRHIFIVFCYSNVASGETLTFKYYNDVDGEVYSIAETVPFQTDPQGDLADPLVFQASVIDIVAPEVTSCPGNITVSNDPGVCGAVVTYAAPVFEDDVDGTGLSGTLAAGLASGALFPVGVTTVTYSYTDAAGNGPAECSFTVTVTDDEAPTAASCPSNITVFNDPWESGAVVDYAAPLFADNCDGSGLTGTLTAGLASGVQFPMGETTVTYTYTDAAGNGPAVCTFTVTVNKGNYAPEVVAPIGSISRAEGFGTVTVDLAPVFSDPDGDDMTYSAVSGNTGVVTVSVDAAALTITEVFPGSSEIVVTASDGSLETDEQFTFTIDNVNDTPELLLPIGNRSYATGFGAVTINLGNRFSDPDGDELTFTAESSNTGVVTVSVSGSVLTIHEAGAGMADVTVTATDNGDGNLEVSDLFTVSVVEVNDAPQLDNPVADQEENEHFGTLELDLTDTFSDPDGDVLTLTAVSSNTGVVTVGMSGTLLTITEVGNGVSVITLTASDGSLSIADQFSVTVVNVNDPPVVNSPLTDKNYDEGFGSFAVSLAPVFIDTDGDALTFSAVSSDPTVVTVSVTGVTLTVTEVGLGTATVTVTASDGVLEADDQFEVTVNYVNKAPEVVKVVDDSIVVEGFGTLEIDLSVIFADPENDALTYSALSSDTEVATAAVDGTLLTLTEVATGMTTISIEANDGQHTTETAFMLTVKYLNKAPVADGTIEDQVMVENIDSVLIDLESLFIDPEGDELTYTITMSEQGIVFYTLEGSLLRVDPYNPGTVFVTVTASDPEGATAEVSFEVQVLKEYLMIVNYGSRRIQAQDTIVLCNNADHISIRVNSKIKWEYTATNFWMVVELNADSSLNVGYSDNLTGADRVGVISVLDVQGHNVEFYIRQSENCETSIADAALPEVSLYPNPVVDRLFIDTGGQLLDGSRLEIIDYRGRLLYMEQVEVDVAGAPLEVDMQGFDAGLYFIRITGDGVSYTGKIAKQ